MQNTTVPPYVEASTQQRDRHQCTLGTDPDDCDQATKQYSPMNKLPLLLPMETPLNLALVPKKLPMAIHRTSNPRPDSASTVP